MTRATAHTKDTRTIASAERNGIPAGAAQKETMMIKNICLTCWFYKNRKCMAGKGECIELDAIRISNA